MTCFHFEHFQHVGHIFSRVTRFCQPNVRSNCRTEWGSEGAQRTNLTNQTYFRQILVNSVLLADFHCKYFCILLVTLKRFYKLMRQNVLISCCKIVLFLTKTGNLFWKLLLRIQISFGFAVVSENSSAEESAKLPRVRVQILWPFTDFRFFFFFKTWSLTTNRFVCTLHSNVDNLIQHRKT